MPNLQKNERYTVTIDAYSSEGLGVTRIDGQVVFVHGGVRGEECVIQILKVLKQVAFARVAEVLFPSEARQTPDCPHFPACGGCQLRHITYEEELQAKRQKVEDALVIQVLSVSAEPRPTQPQSTEPQPTQPEATVPQPTEGERTVVSVETYADCDGSGHGVKVITYSDGTQEEVYF